MSVENGRLFHDRALHTKHCLESCELPRNKIDFRALMVLPNGAVANTLLDRLDAMISGVTVLNSDHAHGVFNRHDRPHVEAVNALAQGLLNEKGAGVDVTTRNVTTVIALTHDVGNNLSRHEHGLTGARLLKDIFSNFDPIRDPQALSVLIGIWAHDEKNGVQIDNFAHIANYAEHIVTTTRKKPLSSEEQALLHKTAEKILIDGVLAPIAADKLDVGRHRLTQAFLDPTRSQAAIENDLNTNPHTQICAYAKKVRSGFSERDTFEQRIVVAANLKDEQDKGILEILRKYRYDPQRQSSIHTPVPWGERWRNDSLSYASSYLATYQRTYWDRLAMLNSCLFAMFPDLKRTTFKVVYEKPGMEVVATQTFLRKKWQFAIFMIWKAIKNARFNDLSTDPKRVPAILRPAVEIFREDRVEPLLALVND